MSDTVIRPEPIDQMLEVIERHKTQQLCGNRLAAIHGAVSFAKKTGNDTAPNPLTIPNLRNRESSLNPHRCWIEAK